MHELIPFPSTLERDEELLTTYEKQLFELRETVEVIWIKLGQICSEIVEKKLYRLRRDDEGNYFRTAQGYFRWLDQQFKERGWSVSYTSINRFVDDYRLYMKELGLTQEEMLLLGKTNLSTLAPAVRKLLSEGHRDDAEELVLGLLDTARATEGLPTAEVNAAVDETTGREMKGITITFTHSAFGRKLAQLQLYWGGRYLNLLKDELTEEQAEWVCRRLGNRLDR